MTKEEVLKELEAYRRLCTHLDYDNDDYMLNGEYEEDNEVIETALKEHELMKQTKIIVADKKISDDDLEKIKNQRMFVSSLKQYEIKPLFDEETQNKFKVLEIIKNKRVNINTLIDCMLMVIDPLKFYNEKVIERLKLTQQEFDLLKEWLEDE